MARMPRWLGLGLTGAVFLTVVEAAILEIRRAYFSGGFLAEDAATSWGARLAFVAGSLLSDLAVLAPVVVLALWAARRTRLGTAAASLLALAVAVAPWFIWTLVSYRIVSQLGDAFDASLMFDLVGGRASEFLAVSASHLVKPLAVLLAGVAALTAAVWGVQRVSRSRGHGGDILPAARRAALTAALTFLLGLVATTGLRMQSDVVDNGLRRKASGEGLGVVAEYLSDVDRDGFGLLRPPLDPALTDSRVYPYAIEIPGNGVDEDGVGGDLPEGPPYDEGPSRPPVFSRRPSIVFFVLESFRGDLIGSVAATTPVTPVLDALGARGISSPAAYSHNGYTVQSRFHYFSGSLAGLRGGTTLVDDFKANGYQVAYFSGQDESFGQDIYRVGFDRADVRYDARVDKGDRFTLFTTPGSLGVSHAVLTERISEFLSSRNTDAPLFMYVNLYDTHFPYHHPGIQPLLNDAPIARGDIVPGERDRLLATYRNTAANVDRAVGGIVDLVEARLGARPAVVVLADHGESLFDEGFLGHGYALNDVQTRIPAIVSDLPLALPEPFGQSDLRDALWTALTTGEGEPTRTEPPGRKIFQYVGRIPRPKQIAFTSRQGRTIYDFSTARVRLAGQAEWKRPSALDEAETREYLEVVHFWERLRLAQSRARGSGDTTEPTDEGGPL
jgi:hypothetical protein